jgi:eukaryotic-like serine/threonine-protein kinase
VGRPEAIDLASQNTAGTLATDGSKENGPTDTKLDGTPKYEAAFASDFYDDMIIGAGKMMSVGAILSLPVVVNNVINVGTKDGNLKALM